MKLMKMIKRKKEYEEIEEEVKLNLCFVGRFVVVQIRPSQVSSKMNKFLYTSLDTSAKATNLTRQHRFNIE